MIDPNKLKIHIAENAFCKSITKNNLQKYILFQNITHSTVMNIQDKILQSSPV